MATMWLLVWSNRPSIIYWHWQFLDHGNTNRFSILFTSYSSQYLLPMMVADFMQYKWISNVETSSRSHSSIIIAQYELSWKIWIQIAVWSLALLFKYNTLLILFMAQPHNVSHDIEYNWTFVKACCSKTS